VTLLVLPTFHGTSTIASAATDRVLILAGTVSGGMASIEATEAVADGLAVDIVDAATWSTMTAAQFASYRAIILGDPTCVGPPTSADIDTAAANAKTWGPVINGNIVILGTDPVFHSGQGGATVTQRGVDFAVNQAGKTGAYITLSCYYHGTASGTAVPLLDGIGSGGFTTTGVGCYNNAHIVALSPALAGITDSTISNWSCSVHEAFQTWPGGLIPLAIARDFDSSYTASDGSQGPPYILAGGDIKSFPMSLSPLSDSASVGGSHTITAQLLDGSTALPVGGAKIGFSVVSGPNAGASGTCAPTTCLTDSAGHVSFTYHSNGQTGTDTIEAFYDLNGNGGADVGEPQTTAGMQWTVVVEPACRGVYVLGARGSGENNNDYGGWGRTIATAISAFRNHNRSRTVTAAFLDYPSHSVATLINPKHGIDTFLSGVDQGINTLENTLVNEQHACPTRPIVLFGYSQGALVVDRALVDFDHAHSPVLAHVVGVGLIADPQRLGTALYTSGSAHSNLNGVSRSLAVYPADDLPGTIYNRITSYCSNGDMVCAFDTGLLLEGTVGWVRAARNTQGVHTNYWQSAAAVVGASASDFATAAGA
jgi:hypothetical protein